MRDNAIKKTYIIKELLLLVSALAARPISVARTYASNIGLEIEGKSKIDLKMAGKNLHGAFTT